MITTIQISHEWSALITYIKYLKVALKLQSLPFTVPQCTTITKYIQASNNVPAKTPFDGVAVKDTCSILHRSSYWRHRLYAAETKKQNKSKLQRKVRLANYLTISYQLKLTPFYIYRVAL